MSLKILISYQSLSGKFVEKLNKYLKSNGYDTLLVTETEPVSLSVRARAVKFCNVFLVIASRLYQQSTVCMELLNYAKDQKKQIHAINPNANYRPFGALGAIIAGDSNCEIDCEESTGALDEAFGKLTAALNSRPKSSRRFVDCLNAEAVQDNENSELKHDKRQAEVLVSYHNDFESVAVIIEDELNRNGIKYISEDSSLGTTAINSDVKVIILIMSPGYEESHYCRKVVELARAAKKTIIPVSTSKGWKPQEWLGLTVAGKLYYRIFDKSQAIKPIYDSTPIKDLLFAVTKALSPLPSDQEREAAKIQVLTKKIEECKAKLPSWPPKGSSEVKKRKKLTPVPVVLPEPQATAEFVHTHYTVTRLTFVGPKKLFDDFGVPLRYKFDCMISYDWKQQELVRNVYMDLNMKSLKIWFDIWGGMEGNTNDAMATAVEDSKVVVVFLSNEYQTSVNCQLEFRYAIARGKPIIFIMTQSNLKLEPWIEPYVKDSYKFEITCLNDEGILHNGVPRIDVIAQAIRTIGTAQPDDDDLEFSDTVFELKQLLNDALDEIANMAGVSRFKTCTRCNKQFDEMSKIGCTMHRAYYLGGMTGLLEGRWVCCNQQKEDSPGCSDTNHIDTPRVWTNDPHYGTHTWVPA